MPVTTLIALTALPCAWLLERHGHLKARWKRWASELLIRVFYPCLILAALGTRIEKAELARLWPLPLTVALLLLLGEAVGTFLKARSGLDDEAKKRSFVFLAILPNYSYLPLLVAQALWGERGVALVVLSSVGADLVLWTRSVGVLDQNRLARGFPLARLLSPPLLSLLLGLLLTTDTAAPLKSLLAPLFPWLGTLGLVTLPLSMFLLGSHLGRPLEAALERKAQSLLLAWRLVVAPALVYALLLILRLPERLPAPAAPVLLLIASMPGAIVSVILSEAKLASPDFAARHMLWGHLAWLISGPFWMYLASLSF